MSLSSIDLGLREILSDPVRRQKFFRTVTQDDIAAQIRALRKVRGLTQTKFAELAGMKQSAVSRIEQAEYASWALATLFRAAGALNARWRMILEPCEDAVKEFLDIDESASQQTTSAPATNQKNQQAAIVNALAGMPTHRHELGSIYMEQVTEVSGTQNILREFDVISVSPMVLELQSRTVTDHTDLMSLPAAIGNPNG
jgi:transcriptional regulator with XRE-family HTH domain